MKVLVTGGAGFIGNHLVNRLVSEGYDVVVLDNLKRGNKLSRDTLNKISLIQGDIRNQDVVMNAAKDCNLIFHFAAVLGVDIVADNPVETMETEALGLLNVANAAIYNSTEKIIYASTSGVYGKSAIENAVGEELLVAPKTSYAFAKRYNEIYLASLFQEKNLQSISLRFFNVYGPKQDDRMVIPRFFQQALKGEDLTIYGDGKQTRDFTFIDDTIESIFKSALLVNGCEIINVAKGEEFSIRELAELTIKMTNSSSNIKFINPPKDRYDFEVERRFGSSIKLEELTGFRPKQPFEEGLKIFYDFFKDKKNNN